MCSMRINKKKVIIPGREISPRHVTTQVNPHNVHTNFNTNFTHGINKGAGISYSMLHLMIIINTH